MTPGGHREVLRIAYPLIVSMGSFTLMQFCDRMFLSWYSPVAIQAAVPAGILSFAFVCGFMALAGYSNTFVAQYYGANDLTGCSRSVAQATWLALLSWPLVLLMILPGQWLIRHSGHPPAVIAAELDYFTILLLGSVSVPLGAAVSGFFTGRGDTFTNMVAALAGNLVNIPLDYAMVFGRWGFPEMGIRGAAWATVFSGFLHPLILFLLYFSRRENAVYATRSLLRLDPPLLLRMVRFGGPSALHTVSDVGSFTLFVLLTGQLGEVQLAVSNIALSINSLAFMPLLGIGIAASILVGQYLGRNRPDTAERAARSALRVGLVYMGAMAVTFVVLPRFYIRLFLPPDAAGFAFDDALAIGRTLLLCMAAWGLFDAVNLVISGALKGAGDTAFVMTFSTIVAWLVFLPGAWVLVRLWHGGIVAAWAWIVTYVIVLAAGIWLRFRGGRWKSMQVIEAAAAPLPRAPGSDAVPVLD